MIMPIPFDPQDLQKKEASTYAFCAVGKHWLSIAEVHRNPFDGRETCKYHVSVYVERAYLP